MKKRTIAVAANFTIEPISRTVGQYLTKLGIDHELDFAPFDQVFQQLIDPSSIFHQNASGVNAIFLRTEELFNDQRSGPDPLEQGRSNTADLAAALEQSENFKVPLFLFVCAPSANVVGDSSLAVEIERVEQELLSLAETTPNLYVFGSQQLLIRYRIKKYDNPVGNSLAHVPYTDQYYCSLGIELARRSDAHFRKPHKVLVLDCDNTLWDGVCGEDGVDGITFPEHRVALQRFAAQLSEAGMVVCLCSKNNEPDVWEVFDRRTEMPLKRNHLVSWKINWEPKSVNLQSLADELQLGLDSFIFVDDDPAVCAEVDANCPDVFTLLLPQKTDTIPEVLEHVWLFDRLKVTKEDKDRSQSYQREVARRSARRESQDLESFLQSLQLVCETREMYSDQIARVSQLSLRTNQFNSTTKRRSEADIKRITSEDGKQILTVNVHDRFGDYGLVGAVTYELTMDSLHVDSFMLSCRALGRGVEYQMLRQLGSIATSAGRERIDIEFVRSEKNTPIHNFLNELDDASRVESDGGSVYRINSDLALQAKPKQKAHAQAAESSPESKTPELSNIRANWKVYSDIALELSGGLPMTPSADREILDRGRLSTSYVEPQTRTEMLLVAIWESQLRLSDVGVLDNFFEIGGDSLLGVSLFVEIEETFGRTLPLSVLIGSPTIAGLATHIDSATPATSNWKYLVPIQEKGDLRPLFCMHAAGGNVLFYRDLAKELGEDQPVYGVQARGVADKSETAHDRVEDMAAEYLREIRSLQPNGPYRLCGSSFGGLVAFETAQQLKELGEDVEVLALFDTYAPGLINEELESDLRNPFPRLGAQVRNACNQVMAIPSNTERLRFLLVRMRKLSTQLKRKVIWKRNQFAIQYSKATGKELPVDLQRNHKAIDNALKNYRPDPYKGELILFRAEDQPASNSLDPSLGWSSFTDTPIYTVEVKGSHGALTVYPFASDLADKLRPFLEAVPNKKELGRASNVAVAA